MMVEFFDNFIAQGSTPETAVLKEAKKYEHIVIYINF